MKKKIMKQNYNLISEQVGFEFRYEERYRRFSANTEGYIIPKGRSKDSEGSFPVVLSGEPGNLE